MLALATQHAEPHCQPSNWCAVGEGARSVGLTAVHGPARRRSRRCFWRCLWARLCARLVPAAPACTACYQAPPTLAQ
eukprot:COSAG01_NODE_28_length_36622_cov_14.695751_4_plen_77_part_00